MMIRKMKRKKKKKRRNKLYKKRLCGEKETTVDKNLSDKDNHLAAFDNCETREVQS